MTELAHGHGVPHAYETESQSVTAAKQQILYHGTVVPNVTHILPASQHGGRISYPDVTSVHHAYATPNLDDAWEYATEAHDWDHPKPGRPRVYAVHGIGGDHHIEDDPTHDEEGHDRGIRYDDKRSPVGFKVLHEMPVPDRIKKGFHTEDKDHWYSKDFGIRGNEAERLKKMKESWYS